jgi:hypothetical protein
MLQNNTVLQDRYRIVEQIGRGGMGAVYRAMDTRLRTTVALKQTLVEGEPLRRAFEREAQLLASLRHPTLPRVSDHFVDQQGQFLVMEYIPGADLGALLELRKHPFTLADVLRWADQLLDALDYLHTHEPPIIHRDIKPQNMKLTARGEIILLDFGLAKGASVQTRVTSTGSIFGYTPHYAPLEQIHGTGTDRRSDLYSLAATMYHLLTGQMPVDALARAGALINEEPDPLVPANIVNPDVPAAVSAILFQAMSQKANQRPPSATAMRAALRDAGAPGSAHPASGATLAEAPLLPPIPAAPAPTTGVPSDTAATLAGGPVPPVLPHAPATAAIGHAPPTMPIESAPDTKLLPASAAPRRRPLLALLVLVVLLLAGAAAAYASGAFGSAPPPTATPAAASAATAAPPAPTNTPAPTIDILQAAGATQTVIAATQQAFDALVGQASEATQTALIAAQQTSVAATQTAAPTATVAPTSTPAPAPTPAAAGPTRTPRPTSAPATKQPTAAPSAGGSGPAVLSVGSSGKLFSGSARPGTISPDQGDGGSCIQGTVLANDGSKFHTFYVQVDFHGSTKPAKHFYDTGNYKICGLGAGQWGVAVYAVNNTPTTPAEQAGHQVLVNLSGQPGEVVYVDFRARPGFAPPTETPEPTDVPPTPTPASGPYDGQWSGPIAGKTAGDVEFHGSFRMEVRGNAIYRISVDGPSCLFETYPSFPNGKPIGGAAFSLAGSPFNPRLGTDASITFSVNGSFASTSEAAGVMTATQNGGSCIDATWSATRQ